MKVSCNKGVASHVGPESCGDDREIIVEALTGEDAGRVLSLENLMLRSADVFASGGRQQWTSRYREGRSYSAWSKAPCTHRSISRGSREIPGLACRCAGPRFEPARGTKAMHGPGKSDGLVVPAKFPNNVGGAPPTAEGDGGKQPSQRDIRQGQARPDTAPG